MLAHGVEATLAINHLGHANLFFRLADRDLLTEGCRIILVTSALHDPKAPGAPAKPVWLGPDAVAKSSAKQLQNGMIRYANAKLAVVFFTWALARRAEHSHKSWEIIVFEPGFAPGRGSKLGAGDLPRWAAWLSDHTVPHLTWLFSLRGTLVSTPAASGACLAKFINGTAVQGSVSGKYFMLYKEKPTSAESYDEKKQGELWDWTIEACAKDEGERARFARIVG